MVLAEVASRLIVQVEVGADQQRQGAFKAAKAEGRQEEHNDQQAHFGLAQRVRPLIEVRTLGGLGGVGRVALGENEERQEKIRRAQSRRDPAGTSVAEAMETLGAKERPEDEPQPKRHADQAHLLGAVCRRGNVRDIRLGHGDIAAAHAREQSARSPSATAPR